MNEDLLKKDKCHDVNNKKSKEIEEQININEIVKDDPEQTHAHGEHTKKIPAKNIEINERRVVD